MTMKKMIMVLMIIILMVVILEMVKKLEMMIISIATDDGKSQ